MRRLRRNISRSGGSADLSLFAGGSCAGRYLYATVPRHGLGNKLNWIGTAAVAASTFERCLKLASDDAETFEDWGLVASAVPSRMPLPAFDAAFTRFLSSIELVPHLARVADAALAGCRAVSASGFVIGAHYRAGDSCDARYENASLKRCAPLVHLITELARAAMAHPGSAIFLASDSVEALASIQSALPKLNFCTSGSGEGAVDMRLLSRMHLIVGSRYSSFSHVAAKWGGVSLVEAG